MAEQTRPPTGLRGPGKRLWQRVMATYVLTPAELLILEQTCRTADELLILERAVRELKELPDLLVNGSMMQPKAHPLLEEVRRHRALLDKLTASLNLPNAGEEAPTASRPAPTTLPVWTG